ncbi:MAG: tRNA (adenosine(37)-N6)-dimethylallyltransferase MiaA [Terrimicrobiaceae bacterium]
MSAEASVPRSSPNNNILFLAGPTGVGKSEIAVELALQIGGEIVCGDAFQIYAGMACLTAQPGSGLTSRVPHHLYGTISPSEPVSAARLAALATPVIEEIRSRGKWPIVVGGSGLYLEAIGGGLDPLPEPDPALREFVRGLNAGAALERLLAWDPGLVIDHRNHRRVARALEIILQTGRPLSSLRAAKPPPLAAGCWLSRTRDDLHDRIQRNVEGIFREGAVEEAAKLKELSETARMAIGFQEALEVAKGKMSIPMAVEQVTKATRQYAKRQMTWFRNRTMLHQVDIGPGEPAAQVAFRCLRGKPMPGCQSECEPNGQ